MKRNKKIARNVFLILKSSVCYTPKYFLGLIFILLAGAILLPCQQILYKNAINEATILVNSQSVTISFFVSFLGYISIYKMMSGETAFVSLSNIFFGQYTSKISTIYEHFFMKKLDAFESEKFYEKKFCDSIENIRVNGIQAFANSMAALVSLIFNMCGGLIGYTIVLAVYCPVLLCVLILITFVKYKIEKYFQNKDYELKKSQVTNKRLSEYYEKLLFQREGIREIKGIRNLAGIIYKKWKRLFLLLQKEEYVLEKKKENSRLIVSGITDVFNWFITVILIMVLVKDKNVGTIIMLWDSSRNFLIRMSSCLEWSVSQVYGNLVFVSDYIDFLGAPSRKEIKEISNIYWNQRIEKDETSVEKKVLIKDLAYTYPQSEKEVLHNINFEVNPGEIVAILGSNGSGKTSLMKIIYGILKPTRGEVVFKVNGVEKEVTCTNFGVAQQEYGRYDLSLIDNILFGKKISSKEEKRLDTICKELGVSKIVENLEYGMNTQLGKETTNHGTDLSGGEWQRIVIARAFSNNGEILFLDEPTASIDPISEIELLLHLKRILNGKTVFLVSHKIPFARIADRIIVMDHGRIVENGTHQQLLENKKTYFNMYTKQKKMYEGFLE